jgi:hypothetical protein
MAVDFSSGSPLAMQLQQVVQAKLADFGWTTGGDDTTLFEYIMLMLANGKNETVVAPENTETHQFAQWLFETIEQLKRADNSGATQTTPPAEEQTHSAADEGSAPVLDTDMEGAVDAAPSVM